MSNGHFFEFYAPFDLNTTIEEVISCFPRFIPIYKIIVKYGSRTLKLSDKLRNLKPAG